MRGDSSTVASTSPKAGFTTGPALARALLSPRSVALIGASDDPAKTAGRPLRFLRLAGFGGAVYPVNPRRTQVQGERAWPDLAALPEVPEHAFVLTATDGVHEAVARCVAASVPVVTVLASGYADAGAEGLAREAALQALVRGTRTRLLGPSAIGVVNPRCQAVLTANAVFAEPDLPAGGLFVASQSGSMIGALASRARARGLGFAGLVSVGGEADLSVGEICNAVLDDPQVTGFLLFMENLRHARPLAAFARRAAALGKPVLVYKLGRSAAAADMAATHTGALAGEDDVADAFFSSLGVVRVHMLDTLLEAHPLARQVPKLAATPPAQRRVGVVTTTGGGAAMVVDPLGLRGVGLARPDATALQALVAAGVPDSGGPVLDLTLAGTRPEVMRAAVQAFVAAPEVSLVLVVVGSSARTQPQLAVEPLRAMAGLAKPVVVMLVPEAPDAARLLQQAGVPVFRSPEVCADAVASVLGHAAPAPLPSPVDEPPPQPWPAAFSEADAYGLLRALGVPHAPALTCPLQGPAPATLPFAYPVVAKLCSAAIAHKTELGGVVLNIASAAELDAALARLRQCVARQAPQLACNQALIQPQLRGALGEVLVGYRVDPDAGPLVMLAAGGIWAELLRDRSIRCAPVDLATARAMIDEVRLLQPLAGLRGRPRGDLAALAQALVNLSQLALRPHWPVAEAEVNPLLVLPEGQGVAAVDALVVTTPTAPAPR